MIRFLISLFLFFLVLNGRAQNLIPNPSGEEYLECPETLENIQDNVLPWQKLRGSPDYFNSCSQNELLGWENVVGNQEPRTGNGYFGALTHDIVPDVREYFGIEFSEPLQIGEEYTMTMFVSLAYSFNNANMATDNIGYLFMTNNYLDSEEGGNIPNFSHYALEEVILDTTEWTEVSYTFTADSSYTMVAVGNFYDDSNTTIISQIKNQKYDVTAYYFFDDFCLVPSSENCDGVIDVGEINPVPLRLYPNPNTGRFAVVSDSRIISWTLRDVYGNRVVDWESSGRSKNSSFIEEDLSSGIYHLHIQTAKGEHHKRFIVQIE